LALFLYAITLFCSAFLLFLVQPIIGQKILPKLGGTPSVWNTCVVFFQLTLLVGYAYTHFTTKLPVRRQILIHCALLLPLPFLILLPYGPFPVTELDKWVVTGANPMLPTLLFLTMIVGIPFFVVSTTAPLLQKWFGSTGHPAAKDPYFLYGASNFGSMLALLLYPAAFEPAFGLKEQSWFYTIGYMALVGLVTCCAVMAFQAMPSAQLSGRKRSEEPETVPSLAPEPPPEPVAAAAQVTTAAPTTAVTSTPPAPAPPPPTPLPDGERGRGEGKPTTATGIKKGGKKHKGRDLAKMAPAGAFAPAATAAAIAASTPSIAKPGAADPDEITWPRRLRWIGLAAVPSSLMLGVTVYVSTDISAIPLFWVLPLALYLLSFILVFMRWPINWLEQAHEYVLYAQPVLLALLVLFMVIFDVSGEVYKILAMLLAFTATALVCHGEMAKDRPSAKHLTEFYLLMSVGGAVGGLFNAIIAPLIFPWGVVELGLALMVAGLLRPTMREAGWTEMLLANLGEPSDTGKHHYGKGGKRIAKPGAETAGLTMLLDFALPIGVLMLLAVLLWGVIRPTGSAEGMFYACIVPLICTACFFARPLRFGLSLGAVLLLTGVYLNSGSVLFTTRSYFGLLRVRQSYEVYGDMTIPYTNLTHGTTNHGMALQPVDKGPDFSRLATTYYHRQGPVGICMERFNWFPKEYQNNDFTADHRIRASLMGLAAPTLGVNLPTGVLVGLWSEPPYAVIGMGTATMASYARPFQTCHFYEIDENIRHLSLPEDGEREYFGYVNAARKRQANVKVLMGDARLRMALPWVPDDPELKDKPSWEISKDHFDKRGGPEYFYHLMVVDAFSSDAIPRHLITKEAIEMYFRRLVQGHWGDWIEVNPKEPLEDLNGWRLDSIPLRFTWEEKRIDDKLYKRPWFPGGVLCVHTSNRHLRLVPVVTDTAAVAEWDDHFDDQGKPMPAQKKHGLVAVRGHDSAPGHSDEARKKQMQKKDDIGHFTSEWVIVARDEKDLKHLSVPSKYNDWCREIFSDRSQDPYWTPQQATGRYVWTDDHTNLMAVFKWPWSRRGD